MAVASGIYLTWITGAIIISISLMPFFKPDYAKIRISGFVDMFRRYWAHMIVVFSVYLWKDLLDQLLSDEDGKFEKTLAELQLPAFIAGSKVGEGMANQLVNQLSALEDQLPPFVLTSEFDVSEGVKFRSWSVAAKDVFDDNAREQLRQGIGDKELAEKLEKIIDSKKVEISFGILNFLKLL